ncbi:UNKNOWN [Stylonychia lemnae]|uniref:Uncharacterized protein n=1 Tax=Stylonychia lemnae TaxID=5949 RepID=A0A077ZZW0_STYLE|nr:UNKNOWN [Stylonychia lemnae]|eukprot:CDW75471.1 UNKNOWN [Stylonychia lemnae]
MYILNSFIIKGKKLSSSVLVIVPQNQNQSKFLQWSGPVCNQECHGYCVSYFPTEGCVKTCGCTPPVALSLASNIFGLNSWEANPAQKAPIVMVALQTTEADISNCISTCNLKCKTENNEKRQSCVTLCVNQCKASYDLSNGNNANTLRPVVSNDTATSNQTNSTAPTSTSTNNPSTQTGASSTTPTKTADTSTANTSTTQATQQTSTTSNQAQTQTNTAQSLIVSGDTSGVISQQASSLVTQNSTTQTVATEIQPIAGTVESNTNTQSDSQTDSQSTAVQQPAIQVLALFENPSQCSPNCIASCGQRSLSTSDQQLTSCFKNDCGCSLEYDSFASDENMIPVAKNFYSYYLQNQRVDSLQALKLGLTSDSHNEKYAQLIREIQPTTKKSYNDMEFTSYQLFIMSFLVIIGSLSIGTTVYFVKKHFFESEESDKLLRYKFIKNYEESESTNSCYHFSKN